MSAGYDPRNHNPTSQNDVVWWHLQRHRSITQGEALEYGITRLAARIYELRGKGRDIKSEPLLVTTRRGKVRVARYVRV